MSFGTIKENQNIEKKVKLCYMDIDSLIVYIKKEDVATRFDTSRLMFKKIKSDIFFQQ